MVAKIYKTIAIKYDGMGKSSRKPEIFTTQVGKGKHLVYVPLKGICSLVNSNFVRKMNSSNPVVKKFFNYVEKHDSIITKDEPWSGLNVVTIAPTTDCNLRCIYCYASGGENPEYLAWNTAKTAIDFGTKNCPGRFFTLNFHGGGEPTLGASLIKKAYAYAEKKCKKKNLILNTSIGTNGVISEDFVHWMAEVGMSVTLSIDGPPEIQNKQRPLKNGRGSYEFVKKTIQLMNELKINYTARPTITDLSVKKMPEIVEHFHSLGIKSVHLQPVDECGRCAVTGASAPSLKKFAEEYIKCFELAESYGMTLQTTAQSLNMHNTYCGACTPLFFVTTEGDITSCFQVTSRKDPASSIFFYGKINGSKVIINEEKADYLRSRKVEKIKACAECFCKYNCAGDCLSSALRNNCSIFRPVSKRCKLNKEIVKYLLLRLLKRGIEAPGFDYIMKRPKL